MARCGSNDRIRRYHPSTRKNEEHSRKTDRYPDRYNPQISNQYGRNKRQKHNNREDSHGEMKEASTRENATQLVKILSQYTVLIKHILYTIKIFGGVISGMLWTIILI